MGVFELARTVTAPPPAVWRVVTDFGGFGRWIPLTRIVTDAGAPGPGWSFTGLTGVGPLRMPDPMTITHWEPGQRYRVAKTGPVVAGWADVALRPGDSGTRLVWREEITLRPTVLGRPLSVLSDPFNRLVFGRALDRMAAEAARAHGSA